MINMFRKIIMTYLGIQEPDCPQCETLKLLLAQEKQEKKRFMDELFKEQVKSDPVSLAPIIHNPLRQSMRMSQMKEHLEAKDRLRGQNDQKVAEITERLEKEVLSGN